VQGRRECSLVYYSPGGNYGADCLRASVNGYKKFMFVPDPSLPEVCIYQTESDTS
jgi:hypothetical protein